MVLGLSGDLAWSQPFEYPEFSRPIAKGLIFDILQDSRGFFWLGTEYGLIRYDGYEEKIYQHEPENPNSLGGNVITCILEDRQGAFWLGTMYNGLQYFDPKTERFRRFPHDPSMDNSPGADYIRALAQDAEGFIWLGTLGGGLDRFDPAAGTFHHFIEEGRGPLSSRSIHDLHIDEDGALWVAAYKGLARWEPENGGFSTFDELFLQDTLNHIIECISEDREGQLWLGMRGGQLFRCSPQENTFHEISLPPPRANPEGGKRIWDIIPRPGGQLWIGRDNGLQIASYQEGNTRDLGWVDGPPDIRVLSLWDGPGDLCWVGTGSGVYKVMTGKKKIDCSQAAVQVEDSLFNPSVTTFSSLDTSRIWAGTTQGLFTYDFRTGRLNRDWMRTNKLPLLEEKNITALYQDSRHRLWISTLENFGERFELWRLNVKNGRLENLSHRVRAFYTDITNSIVEDSLGNIWLANGLGLIRYEYGTDRFYWYQADGSSQESPPLGSVNKVFVDSRGWLWIGTNASGLVRYDAKADRFQVMSARNNGPSAISDNRINDIAEDSTGNLWVATPGGLNYLHVQDVKFTRFSKRDGLPDNTLHSLQWGPSGGLWIGTKNGLARYLPSTGVFEVFQVQDGIQDTEFWHRAAFRDHRGYLYFGGGGGVNVFHPDSLEYHLEVPPVFLTNFSLFNEPVRAGDKNGLLSIDISFTNEIVLAHSQNVITLGYTALNYRHTEKNQFAYQLEGFDPDWQYVGDKREVTYTNLDPGKYVFRVKASNDDGIWNEEGTALRLIIRPQWWGTWWARLLFFGVGAALIYTYIRLRWQQQLARRESLRLQEIDALKTELYTNITHEFRTPLTLILGPVEKAIRNANKVSGRELKVIRQNGRRLLALANQMLQLRRLEAGMIQPEYYHGDVLPVLRYAIDAFESSAQNKDIALRLESPASPIFMDHDREKLLDILVNLLSNALKFTLPGGRITVGVTVEDSGAGSWLTVQVEDTGEGIPPEEVPKIFDRFHRALSSGGGREGAGIGLAVTQRLVILLEGTIEVESTPGEGSVFRLRLPIRHESLPVEATSISEKREIPENVFPGEEIKAPGSASPASEIMIVEDNLEVARFIAGCLPEGMKVIMAANGQAGLDRALSDIPDLIISDVMMPEMDGFELTRRLKSDDRTSHIPVILLTARADDSGRLEGLEGGADAYLVKPFNPEELRVRILKLLEGRRRLQAYYLREAGVEWMIPAEDAALRRENVFLQKVRNIVEQSLDDSSFTIEQLSHELSMSHAQLHRKMTALTGQSALKFVRSLRLAKARHLLRETDLNISEIAYQTGFNDPAYFSKVFSGEVGCTPSAFRESQ